LDGPAWRQYPTTSAAIAAIIASALRSNLNPKATSRSSAVQSAGDNLCLPKPLSVFG